MTRRPARTVRTDTKVETSVVEASRSLNSAVLGMAGPGLVSQLGHLKYSSVMAMAMQDVKGSNYTLLPSKHFIWIFLSRLKLIMTQENILNYLSRRLVPNIKTLK